MKQLSVLIAMLASAMLVVAAPASLAEEDDGKRQEWTRRHQELKAKHAGLGQDLAQARIEYSRGRSNRHPRGEGKAALIAEIARLEEEFARVDQEFQDFPEKARRQGALPGWFRDLDEPTPPAARPAAPSAVGDSVEGAVSDAEPPRTSSRAQERSKERANRRLGRD